MADPIVIQVVSEASQAVKGVTDVGAALDKTGKSIDAVTKNGKVDVAQLETKFRDLTNTVTHENQKQNQDFEITTRERTKIVREGINKTGESAKQAALQGIQSIDGSVQGALSGVQAVVAGVFGTFGPEGLAIGAALSAAVGLIGGAFANAGQDAQELQQRVSDLTATLEKAADGAVGVDDITASLQKLSTESDGSKVSLDKLFQTAKDSGNSATALADAYAGQTKDLKALREEAAKKLKQDDQEVFAHQAGRESQNSQNVALLQAEGQYRKTAQAQRDYLSYLDSAITVNKKAATETKQYNEAVAALAKTSGQIIQAGADAFSSVGDQIAAKQQKLDDAAKAASEKTKHTVIANNIETAQSFIDEQATELAALTSSNANKIAIYEKFGKDAGAAVIKDAGSNTKLLAALANATPAEVQTITSQYKAAGKAAGENLQKEAQAALDKQKLTAAPVAIKPDSSAYDSFIKNVQNTRTVKNIQLNFVDRNGKALG